MEEIRWRIGEMYPDEQKTQEDMKKIREAATEMRRLSEDPQGNLKEILALYEETQRLAEHLLVYAAMRRDEDSRVSESQKLQMASEMAAVDFQTATAFLQPYLTGLSKEQQASLLKNEEYASYHLFLSRVFRFSKHTLSPKEEELLSKFSFAMEAPSNIAYYLTNADINFPIIDALGGTQLTGEAFTLHQKNPDVAVRKEVFEKYYETYRSFGNTLAATYYNNVKALATEAQLRGYDSCRQQALFRDDVSEEVYDALLESIHRNLPVIHRYYAAKKSLLGLKEQHMYDVYLPIAGSSGKTYTFEEARDLCIASVAPLGEEYGKIYRRAFEEGWIDAYPRPGKRGGAYSSGSYDGKPYVLMNFDGTLDSVFTMAHEMGHSMHSYLSRQANDYLASHYTIFVAEVASTFNENLLLHYLMEHAETSEERLALLDHHLDSFKSTVFRQTMFAEFEKIVHARVEKGEALTAKEFDEIYYSLNQQYFGAAMISDPLIAHEWMRIPHFYEDFYVYKYATGYCAATALAQGVLDGKPHAVENYFAFLRDGCKHFPIEQLRKAGCDMANPASVDSALHVFEKRVEELEALVS